MLEVVITIYTSQKMLQFKAILGMQMMSQSFLGDIGYLKFMV